MAVSQYSCDFVRWNPMALSLGAIALTKNHTQNAMIMENVEIVKVRHAIPESQFSSGSQFSMRWWEGLVLTMSPRGIVQLTRILSEKIIGVKAAPPCAPTPAWRHRVVCCFWRGVSSARFEDVLDGHIGRKLW